MSARPALHPALDADEFLQYYYLKEELVQFCRENGLQTSGGKQDVTARIAHFLRTGELLPAMPATRKKAAAPGDITPDTAIEPHIVCTQAHRAFFSAQIGRGFSFSVAFQKWLKENAGKTYGDAVQAYAELRAQAKGQQTTISRQFEYNTYIRAFFADNPGKPLADAIRCWKQKKALPGHNRYERDDLCALENG